MALLPGFGPLPAFNFYIGLIDDSSTFSSVMSVASIALGGFSECTGLDSQMAVVDYLEGGVNDRVHRFPGRFSFPNITLSRGIGFSEELYLWHEEFLKGEGKRRNGIVMLANEMRVPVKCWTFERGLPIKWTGPTFNALQSAMAIEKIEIAHEKLSLVVSPGQAAADVAGAIF